MYNSLRSSPLTVLGFSLALIYLLSGASSLAYEILWSRMLSIQFGVSIFGVVLTVSSFMLGLGVGSLLGLRLARHSQYPLRILALLELLVALSALLIPNVLQSLEAYFVLAASGLDYTSWSALQMLVVMCVLMLPAIAMGAGFPLILSAAEHSGVSLGSMYGMNALGGALGALLPLWLLPAFAWLNALYVVAVLGLILSALLLFISWRHEQDRVKPQVGMSLAMPPRATLLIYAGIGAAALLLEIGWTRLFGMVLLRTEYVLAIILMMFLLGIGLGSLLARRLSHAYWFTGLPLIAATCAIASLWCLPIMASWVEIERFDSFLMALLQQGAVIAALTLPVTLVLGAWLPMLANRVGKQHQSGVWLYGVNSIGAAVGTLLAGFLLIPAIGSSATIVLGATLLLILGLSWAHTPRAWFALIVLGIFAAPVLEMPQVAELMPQAYAGTRQLSLHEDAISITHVVEAGDGQRQLLADLQRMDASTDPTAVVVQMNQARLPLLLHPQPDNVLFLGLGTGISAAGSLAFPGLERTAVELSQGAIKAAQQQFQLVNNHVAEKLHIVRDDARHFLMSDDTDYDVIIGDLFHPDLVGRSALLSRQQFQRAREHLTEDGIFVQWLALNQFDLQSLQIVLRTFQRVFADAVMFVDGFRLLMVGTRQQPVDGEAIIKKLHALDGGMREAQTGGEGVWTWLSRYWGPISPSEGKIQDEWAPLIEYRLPGARYNGKLDLSAILEWLLTVRPRLQESVQQLALAERHRQSFENAYAATDLAYQRWQAIMSRQAGAGQHLLPLAYQANPRDRWIGFALADSVLAERETARRRGVDDRRLYESVLKIRPDHTEALRALWHLSQAAGETDLAGRYRDRLQALSPLDRELQVQH